MTSTELSQHPSEALEQLRDDAVAFLDGADEGAPCVADARDLVTAITAILSDREARESEDGRDLGEM
jgi:hypothetical protein